MRRTLTRLAVASPLLAFAPTARAQTAPPLPTVPNAASVGAAAASAPGVPPDAGSEDTGATATTITATRVPTLAERVPAGVTIIGRKTIEQRGYTTLADALEAVPGLRVVQSGGPGGNASVFIRGTNSNHVLVLRDGLPVNDPADPGGAFNFGVDTLDDIERIEVVRGPASSLYGSGAIGGVINLISRHGADDGSGQPHGGATLAGGSQRRFLGQANVAGATGAFDYAASVENQSTRGFDITPKRESGVYTGAPNGFHTYLGTLDLGYTPVEGTRIGVFVRARRSVFGLDELGSPAFDATGYGGQDDSLFGRIGVTSKLFGGTWETGLFLAGLQDDRRYVELLEAADPNQASGDSRYHGRRADVQWNNTIHLPDIGPSTNAAVTAGYEHIADSAVTRVNTNGVFGPYSSGTRNANHSDAGHAGVQTTLFGRLTLTGDLRDEEVRYGGGAFTWRVGGVLAVPEAWTRFKAAYGTAFRAPSLFDLFGVDAYGYQGNPALKPERSQGYELGVGLDVPVFGRADGVTLDVTYFDNRIRDLIESVFTPVDTEINVASARAKGVETSLTIKPARWLDATLTYTYTDARNTGSGAPLLRRPFNAGSLSARIAPWPGLTIAPEVVYTGNFYDFLVDNDGFSTSVGRQKPGTIVNLTVNYDVVPQATLFVIARNIGGSRFEPASGFQTPGPSVLAGVRGRF